MHPTGMLFEMACYIFENLYLAIPYLKTLTVQRVTIYLWKFSSEAVLALIFKYLSFVFYTYFNIIQMYSYIYIFFKKGN